MFIFSFQTLNAQCDSHKKSSHSSSWNNHSDLVDIVSNSDDFSTLTVALKTAGLVKTLKAMDLLRYSHLPMLLLPNCQTVL